MACVLDQDQRIESAVVQPPLNVAISFTQLSQWVWRVSRNGKWVGTVHGDNVIGFTARDVDHEPIGRGYASAEAAMQAWHPAALRRPAK